MLPLRYFTVYLASKRNRGIAEIKLEDVRLVYSAGVTQLQRIEVKVSIHQAVPSDHHLSSEFKCNHQRLWEWTSLKGRYHETIYQSGW